MLHDFQNSGNAEFLNLRQAFSRKRAASRTAPRPTTRFSNQNANGFTEVSLGGASRERPGRGSWDRSRAQGAGLAGIDGLRRGAGRLRRPRGAVIYGNSAVGGLSVPIHAGSASSHKLDSRLSESTGKWHRADRPLRIT